jgi:hypothetical protein
MAKIYVVVENNWEYNDEIWYQPEGQGYNVVKGFRSPEKAQAECDKLNKKSNGNGINSGLQINYADEDSEEAEFAILYKVVTLETED